MSSVMVVEDMAIFRDPIAASLRLAGFRVVTAADGQEGLSKLSQEKPDLVLLDVAMPVLDGLGFLQSLRTLPAFRQTPVIVLTAVSEKESVVEMGRLGVRDYLLKSRFSLQEMLERIRRYLPGGVEAAPAAETSAEAAPAKTGPVSRRRSPRTGVDLAAELRLLREPHRLPVKIRLRDTSMGGVGFSIGLWSPRALPRGQEFVLQMPNPEGGYRLLLCRARHSRRDWDGSHRIGGQTLESRDVCGESCDLPADWLERPHLGDA